ncbi:hypothetical protein D3C71_1730450 [compost metagenome]
MRIHSYGRYAEGIGYHNIGRFAAYPGKLHKLLMRLRDLSMIILQQDPAQALDILRFVPEQADASDVLLQFGDGDSNIILGRTVLLKKGCGHFIHRLVRTLGGH